MWEEKSSNVHSLVSNSGMWEMSKVLVRKVVTHDTCLAPLYGVNVQASPVGTTSFQSP